MTKTQYVHIENVCKEIFAGGDVPKNALSYVKTEECCVPIFSNGEKDDGLYGYTNHARVNEPSITVSARGTIGYTSKRCEPFFPVVRLITLTPKDDVIDLDYLFYATQNYKFEGSGTSIPQLTVPMLKKYAFPLPKLEEQKAIAKLFQKLDCLISLRKQQLVKLDELIKARFVEMFGTYPKNENDFPVTVISDVANVSVGVVIKPAQYYVEKEVGVKAFRSLNIGPMYIKDNDWVYFSSDGNAKNRKSQLHENDLLIVRSGAPGVSCVVTKEYEGCNAIDVIIAHPNLSKVNPWYLCAYTNYPHGKKQIDEGTGGAAQQHFNVGKCSKVKIMIPPLSLQNDFAAFVERVDQQKQTIQQSLEKLELMKKALMQEYFG